MQDLQSVDRIIVSQLGKGAWMNLCPHHSIVYGRRGRRRLAEDAVKLDQADVLLPSKT